jgi:magnesium chelatase family protein
MESARRRRVCRSAHRQLRRAGKLNADLSGGEIQLHCRLDRNCRALLAQARERLKLSARATHRALRWPAPLPIWKTETGPLDLPIGPAHLAEALQLRRCNRLRVTCSARRCDRRPA